MTAYSREDLQKLADEIVEKLRMVNVSVIRIDTLSSAKIESLVELHDFVTSRSTFSIGEMDAIAGELGEILGTKK
ncbi:MAG: DUF1128 family protein [Bacilli bacterium]